MIEKDAVVKPIEAFGNAVRSNGLSKSCDRTVLGEDDSMGDSGLISDELIFAMSIDGNSTHLV